MCSFVVTLNGQSLEWVFLPDGDENFVGCVSNSSIGDSTACFGLAYIPGETGTVSSYTVAYFVECNNDMDPVISANSCIMDDNTAVFPDCASSGFTFLQASGQNGNFAVATGDSLIIHQICITLGANDTIEVLLDDITGATVSMDLPGGVPYTDEPSVPEIISLTDTIFGFVPCDTSKVCSMDFGSEDTRISFDLNGNDNILDAASDTSLTTSLTFDVYDEINEICQIPGGMDDIELTIELLTTQDQYGHFFLDTLAGEEHKLLQASDGLQLELPFGSSITSESSSADTRGLVFRVEFAGHIGIYADQFSVDLADVNSIGEVFESAAVIFYDALQVPYDTIVYNGFYQDSSDLSGNCILNTTASAWESTGDGIGSFFLDSLNRVDPTDPCNPLPGTSTKDTVSIRAVEDAGISPTDYIGGFEVIIMGEDIAAPSTRDDGSEMDGDDDIISNANTSTNAILQSKIMGFTVDGCVFNPIILPVDFLYFTAKETRNQAALEWKTANIVNHSHYEVEWSRDGRSFVTLGKVESGTETNGVFTHEFTHISPEHGLNYYRIKQLDFNGKYAYTDIEVVAIDRLVTQLSAVYPNPTNDEINIEFLEPKSEEIAIELYSIHGEILSQVVTSQETQIFTLNLQSYPMGTYILRVGNEIHRLVKN